MRFVVGGMRGSLPVSGPAYVNFGGHTTSFLIRGEEGEILFIDGGTGLKELEGHLEGPAEILFLLTHYHLDHLTGLPGFSFLYDRRSSVEILGPFLGEWGPEEALKRLLSEPFWPVPQEELRGLRMIKGIKVEVGPRRMDYKGLSISWCPLHHPGGSVAYRVEEPESGASVVVATDVEWSASSSEEKEEFLRFAKEPSAPKLLVFDANYSRKSYEKRKGWGHSTWEEAIYVGKECGAQSLLLTHLGFEKKDEELFDLQREVQSIFPEARIARSGLSVRLGEGD